MTWTLLYIAKAVIVLVFLLLCYVTLTPLLPTKRWWVRGWDFPRAHIAVVAALTCVAALWLFGPVGWFMALASGVMAFYQALRVLPYTPLWKTEVDLLDGDDPTSFTLMSSNVLKENEQPDMVVSHVGKYDADVLLLMEIDPVWDDRLRETLSRYPTVERQISDGHYGMIFATRLDVVNARFEYFADDDTPTIVATLEDKAGRRFTVIGLHPRPPVPGEDTEERDSQMRTAARVAHHLKHPVIAMGDFNDAAWSDTTLAFKAHGGYRDPRVGRGIYPSFDATGWFMRFPIDQFFVTEGVDVYSFERGPFVGSDHFPLHARVRIAPPE